MRLLGTLWGMHDPKQDMKSGLLIGNRGYDLVLFGEVADVVMRCSKSQQSTIREIFLFKEDIRSTHLNDRFLAAGTNTGISTVWNARTLELLFRFVTHNWRLR